MVPKTERFEMRLDEQILERVDRWRADQADLPSRAESMRRLIETGLADKHGDVVRFSDGEKLILLMMRDLFRHLKLEDADSDPDFIAQVIFGGHYWAPKLRLTGVFHGYEDSPAHLAMVRDVLEMWDCLERGFEQLSMKDRERLAKEASPFGDNPKFPGFDGNQEAAYLSVAAFLVNEMDRFTRFAGRDLNAHLPTLAMYERMLRAFRPMQSLHFGGELGVSQLIDLLKAMPYPGRTNSAGA